jgi:hypothetical protein
VTAVRWSAVPATRDPLLKEVDLRGAHDFRHTYATWLEDAGIPARVIDELMGHDATGRRGQQRGSAMGAHYRHTTPEMAARAVDAIQQRLTVVLGVAELAVESPTMANSRRRLALRMRGASSRAILTARSLLRREMRWSPRNRRALVGAVS